MWTALQTQRVFVSARSGSGPAFAARALGGNRGTGSANAGTSFSLTKPLFQMGCALIGHNRTCKTRSAMKTASRTWFPGTALQRLRGCSI